MWFGNGVGGWSEWVTRAERVRERGSGGDRKEGGKR